MKRRRKSGKTGKRDQEEKRRVGKRRGMEGGGGEKGGREERVHEGREEARTRCWPFGQVAS